MAVGWSRWRRARLCRLRSRRASRSGSPPRCLPTMFIATLLTRAQWRNARSPWPWPTSAVAALLVARFWWIRAGHADPGADAVRSLSMTGQPMHDLQVLGVICILGITLLCGACRRLRARCASMRRRTASPPRFPRPCARQSVHCIHCRRLPVRRASGRCCRDCEVALASNGDHREAEWARCWAPDSALALAASADPDYRRQPLLRHDSGPFRDGLKPMEWGS